MFWPWHILLAVALLVSAQVGYGAGIKQVPVEYGKLAFWVTASTVVATWIVAIVRHDQYLQYFAVYMVVFGAGLIAAHAVTDPNAGEGMVFWVRIIGTFFFLLLYSLGCVLFLRRIRPKRYQRS